MVRISRLAWCFLALQAGCSCNEEIFQGLSQGSVTSANYGKWLSLDIGPDGNPAMAYYDVSNTALGFARGELQSDGTVVWHHEAITGYPENGFDSSDAGKYASMKVAPDGTVWIAYQENRSLWVAHRVGGTWTTELVDSGSGLAPNTGNWASLSITADGHPVIAHHDMSSGELRVTRNLGSWSTETVATGQAYSGPTSELDPTPILRPAAAGQYARLIIHDETEYIAWHDGAFQNLHLTKGSTGNWSDEIVASEEFGNLGQWPSIWTDGTTMAMAFEDRAHGQLRIAERDSTSGPWTLSVADQGDYLGSDTEIFKRGDILAVVYFDGRTNDMKFAQRDNATWTTEMIGGANGALGFFNEVVHIGNSDFAASYDFTNQRIFWRELP